MVNADNVVQLLTHDQYEGLVDQPTAAQARAEAGREDQHGSLAKAALAMPWKTSHSTSNPWRLQ